ncbi:hypothetical protein [Haloarchaeobius salinus]|uniref:hypothetical protein n=1 Tax=Haloarchaeobius salinus TaxID=1198298 RepID=UPI00210E2380|nr:hypothetical protein [Haloarchaeobius salinus]
MPGSPQPVLGSDLATLAAAVGVAAVAVAVVAVLGSRESRPPVVAAVVGVAYSLLALGVYFAARTGAQTFLDMSPPETAVAFAALGVVVVLLQAAVPAYGFIEQGSPAWLLGMFASTTFLFALLLRVGGESDVLVLYPFFGSMALVATVVPVAVEQMLGALGVVEESS